VVVPVKSDGDFETDFTFSSVSEIKGVQKMKRGESNKERIGKLAKFESKVGGS
jgi:hypothetical protein